MLEVLRREFDCPVGLSDHSGTIFPGLAGATLGMDVLEIHVTFSREMFGPDVPASITFEEMKTLVEGIRFIETMKANPIDKDAVSEESTALREMFMKGLVAAVNIDAGQVLNERNLDARKPMAGISVARYDEVVGRRARHALQAGTFLQEADLL
jgi:N-acetylneuraminate synthase